MKLHKFKVKIKCSRDEKLIISLPALRCTFDRKNVLKFISSLDVRAFRAGKLIENDTMGLPVLENVPGLGRHTVDTPVGLPLLVTDGDTEPAIVGPDDLDGFLLLALDEELLPLAGVASPDGGLKLPCNKTVVVRVVSISTGARLLFTTLTSSSPSSSTKTSDWRLATVSPV